MQLGKGYAHQYYKCCYYYYYLLPKNQHPMHDKVYYQYSNVHKLFDSKNYKEMLLL